MRSLTYIFIVLGVLNTGCLSETNKKYSAQDHSFQYNGRVQQFDESVGLISSGAYVEFLAHGSEISINLQTDTDVHNYVTVAINNQYKGRFKILPDQTNTLKFKLEEGANRISVFKATEAFNGKILFLGAETEQIEKLDRENKKTIEFIGDSITCGALMDDSQVPCGQGEYLDQHNAYLSYGSRIARELDADFLLSSVSGIGMYRNWNDENIEEAIMPQVYENLYLNKDNSVPYDFKVVPDLVSICLGTNDMSQGDGMKPRLPFNAEKFTENYINFVKTVYKQYPKVKIILLNSPMINGDSNDVLVSCLKNVHAFFKTQGKEIHLFEYNKIYANGCGYHPSVKDNEEMSEVLMPIFKNLLE